MIRKVVFTCITAPLGYKTFWAFGWQRRRKQEKIKEIEARKEKLYSDPQPMDLDGSDYE